MAQDLIAAISAFLSGVFFVFIRVGPALSVMPGYGERSVPARVKLVAALALSAALVPLSTNATQGAPNTSFEKFELVVMEAAIGLFIGLMSRGVVFLIQTTGSMIGQTVSLAQAIGSSADLLPAIGHVLNVSALALFFASPLAGIALQSLALSLSEIEFLGPLLSAEMSLVFSRFVDLIFSNSFTLSAGFIGTFFLIYMFQGFVNRAMPQFMVTFIGVPFVALYSMEYLKRTSEIILRAWEAQSLEIILVEFDLF